jgi:DNA polymerase I
MDAHGCLREDGRGSEHRRATSNQATGVGNAKRYRRRLQGADPSEMVIHRRISKLDYDKRCVQASTIAAYRRKGVKVSPGMTVGYVVRDASRWDVDTEWDASEFDLDYYGKLLFKAWEEAAFVFNQ